MRLSFSAILNGLGLQFAQAIVLTTVLTTAHGAQSFPNLGARDIRPSTTGDGATGDSFGARVALCDGEFLVAATGDQTPIPSSASGQSAGSVRRFRVTPTGLEPLGKIELLGVEQSALFGLSLSCDTAELFIGAPGVGTLASASDAGTVFRYARIGGGWQFNGEVPGARPAGDARFGYASALDSEALIIGAPGENAVYVYRRAGLTLTGPQRVQATGIAAGAGFGRSVAFGNALAGDEFAVAAPDLAPAAVVRFSFAGPATEIARLTGPISFGRGLQYVGTQLMVGSPDVNGLVGRVDIFDTATGALSQTLAAPASGGAVEQFGENIASFAGTTLIAAPAARFNGVDAEGAVHRYTQAPSGTWRKTATLNSPEVANTRRADVFGNAIAIAASGIYVGAPYADAGGHPTQGRAYRFDSAGAAVASVDSGRGAAFDRFGLALAISQKPIASGATDQSERAIVGAFLVDSPVGIETGEATIYRRTRGGWQVEATLVPPDAQEEQRFGVSVDIDGDFAVVGSYWDVIGNTVDAGSAYVFQRVAATANRASSWQFLQKLTAPQPRERALFGFAVAIDGDRIAVGARGDSEFFSDQGGVVFFQRDVNGVFQPGPMLRPPLSAGFDSFAAFIDLRGDTALVGAPGAVRADSLAGGRAYLMTAAPGSNDWGFAQTLQDPTGTDGAGFGLSVSLGLNPMRAYVGAPFTSVSANAAVGRGLEFRPPTSASPDASRATDWVLVRSIESPITAPGTQFATSLAAHPNGVVLGAIGVDAPGLPDVGAGFFAPHVGPTEIQIAPLSARAAMGRTAAAANSGLALFGAPGTATVNPQEGAVFEYLGDGLFGDGVE